MRALALAVLIIAGACSKPRPAAAPMPENRPEPAEPAQARAAPPPSNADARFEAMMQSAVAMFVAMGRAAEAGGSDCGKVADGIGRVLDQHQTFLADAKRLQQDAELKKRGEVWMSEHSAEIMAPIQQVGAAAQRCASDARFIAVVKRLEALN